MIYGKTSAEYLKRDVLRQDSRYEMYINHTLLEVWEQQIHKI